MKNFNLTVADFFLIILFLILMLIMVAFVGMTHHEYQKNKSPHTIEQYCKRYLHIGHEYYYDYRKHACVIHDGHRLIRVVTIPVSIPPAVEGEIQEEQDK